MILLSKNEVDRFYRLMDQHRYSEALPYGQSLLDKDPFDGAGIRFGLMSACVVLKDVDTAEEIAQKVAASMKTSLADAPFVQGKKDKKNNWLSYLDPAMLYPLAMVHWKVGMEDENSEKTGNTTEDAASTADSGGRGETCSVGKDKNINRTLECLAAIKAWPNGWKMLKEFMNIAAFVNEGEYVTKRTKLQAEYNPITAEGLIVCVNVDLKELKEFNAWIEKQQISPPVFSPASSEEQGNQQGKQKIHQKNDENDEESEEAREVDDNTVYVIHCSREDFIKEVRIAIHEVLIEVVTDLCEENPQLQDFLSRLKKQIEAEELSIVERVAEKAVNKQTEAKEHAESNKHTKPEKQTEAKKQAGVKSRIEANKHTETVGKSDNPSEGLSDVIIDKYLSKLEKVFDVEPPKDPSLRKAEKLLQDFIKAGASESDIAYFKLNYAECCVDQLDAYGGGDDELYEAVDENYRAALDYAKKDHLFLSCNLDIFKSVAHGFPGTEYLADWLEEIEPKQDTTKGDRSDGSVVKSSKSAKGNGRNKK